MTQNAIYKKWLMPFCKAWSFHNDLFWKAFKHHANIMRLLSYSLINTNPITPLVTIIGHVYCFTLLLPKDVSSSQVFFSCTARFRGR